VTLDAIPAPPAPPPPPTAIVAGPPPLPQPTPGAAPLPPWPPPDAPAWPADWQPSWPATIDPTPVQVLSDGPYTATDHLLAPQLHGLSFTAAGRDGLFGVAVLGGSDRLQYHRWALDGLIQLGSSRLGYGGAASYANQQLAPFTIVADVLALRYHDTWPAISPLMSPALPRFGPYVLDKSEAQADLFVSRQLYGAPADLGFFYVDDDQPDEPTLLVKHRRAAGPFASVSYVGVESTPYSGARRALALFPTVTLLPGGLNTADATVTDLRLEIVGVLPLPLSRRHTLTLDLVGRDLFGLPAGARWLQVGGGTSALAIHRPLAETTPPEVTIDSLPGLHFVEPLRGYEDYPIATDRILIAQAAYRYPIIIDRGVASTLWLLPSSFLREIDLELFGSAATDAHGDPGHVAGGAAATLAVGVWRIPLSLRYQIARRVEDDHALVQILQLAAQ
jgi:hypothetical protein